MLGRYYKRGFKILQPITLQLSVVVLQMCFEYVSMAENILSSLHRLHQKNNSPQFTGPLMTSKARDNNGFKKKKQQTTKPDWFPESATFCFREFERF